MSRREVCVIDYGAGNLLSVCRALEHCGAAVKVSDVPAEAAAAARLILPGVGAFGQGMDTLTRLGLADALREYALKGRPLLGVCLGMQMLLERSTEFGDHAGLGLIAGEVRSIDEVATDGRMRKLPHMGWSDLRPAGAGRWGSALLTGLEAGTAFYFVHSFCAVPRVAEQVVAVCDYEGLQLPAVVAAEHVYGCQFHPEKSAAAGLRILENFLAL